MKVLLAALALAGSAALAAPAAAAPVFVPASPALHGGVSVGVGIGVGRRTLAPRPVWGVTGYRTEARTVFVGYDRFGHPVHTTRWVAVPVYGWVHPAPVRVYRPYLRPHVGIGLGFRF
jgi:hypothetical protein